MDNKETNRTNGRAYSREICMCLDLWRKPENRSTKTGRVLLTAQPADKYLSAFISGQFCQHSLPFNPDQLPCSCCVLGFLYLTFLICKQNNRISDSSDLTKLLLMVSTTWGVKNCKQLFSFFFSTFFCNDKTCSMQSQHLFLNAH